MTHFTSMPGIKNNARTCLGFMASFVSSFKYFHRGNISKCTFSLNLDPKLFSMRYLVAMVPSIRRKLEITGDFEHSIGILERGSNVLCDSLTFSFQDFLFAMLSQSYTLQFYLCNL